MTGRSGSGSPPVRGQVVSQDGDVEAGAVGGEHDGLALPAREESRDLGSELVERWLVGDVLGLDVVDVLRRERIDVAAGVHEDFSAVLDRVAADDGHAH